MSDDLTNSQMALLCDIAEYDLEKATDEQKRDLHRLLSDGYVEPSEGRPRASFQPTSKGMNYLGERGAGLNEA